MRPVRFAGGRNEKHRQDIGSGESARHTDDMVHDLDAAWWMAEAVVCHYEAGRVHA